MNICVKPAFDILVGIDYIVMMLTVKKENLQNEVVLKKFVFLVLIDDMLVKQQPTDPLHSNFCKFIVISSSSRIKASSHLLCLKSS